MRHGHYNSLSNEDQLEVQKEYQASQFHPECFMQALVPEEGWQTDNRSPDSGMKRRSMSPSAAKKSSISEKLSIEFSEAKDKIPANKKQKYATEAALTEVQRLTNQLQDIKLQAEKKEQEMLSEKEKLEKLLLLERLIASKIVRMMNADYFTES